MLKRREMPRPAPPIQLSAEEKELLESWSRKAKTEQRLAHRAKIILLAASGLSGQGIAEQLRTRPARISKWLGRFSRERIAGLADQPRSGTRQRKIDATLPSRTTTAARLSSSKSCPT